MSSTVETTSGRVQGSQIGPLLVFRNVPYAQAARFRPPEPPKPWADLRDGTRRGPVCPQAAGRLQIGGGPGGMLQSEACQNLTVTTPSLTGRRPVMVWIHGGAYMSGGGEAPASDALRLAAAGDVVVIAISYRLAVFGYLWSSDPARRNLGLQDQLAAFDWVLANVERFGGDPDNITAFGQSAGGHSIAAMLRVRGEALPFRRMILHSAALGVWPSPDEAAKLADVALEHLGSDPDTADAADLIAAGAAGMRTSPLGMPFAPVLPEPAQRPTIDAIVGWARDDGAPFIALRGADPPPAHWFDQPAAERYTRRGFADPAEAYAAATPPGTATYLYRIDWRPEGSPYGACHAIDVPLLFGDEEAWRGAAFLGAEPWPAIDRVGRPMRSAWTAFATTGDPNRDGDETWNPFAPGQASPYRSFDA